MTVAIDRLDGPRGIALPRVAALCTALMFIVIVASSFLRHHADQAAWASELSLARQVHRVAATLVLLGAVAMVLLARRAQDRVACRLAPALLGLALLLSAVGVAAGASRAAPVVLVNLLGGFAMLALCVRLGLPLQRQRWDRAATIALAIVVLQAAAGALASATASPECVGLTDCAWPALLHRASGVLLAVGLIVLGLHAAWRQQRWEGAALALLALLLLLVGALSAGIGSTTVAVLVVVHNALAAAALAFLARLA
jgi:cytochrome c oxidase assembly protein subunit 15